MFPLEEFIPDMLVGHFEIFSALGWLEGADFDLSRN